MCMKKLFALKIKVNRVCLLSTTLDFLVDKVTNPVPNQGVTIREWGANTGFLQKLSLESAFMFGQLVQRKELSFTLKCHCKPFLPCWHTHTKTHQKYKKKYTCSGDLLRFSTRQDSRCIIQTAAPSATLFIKIYKKYFHCADYTPICQSMTKHSIIHRKDWQRMSGRKKVRAT